jgi:hypothetical protein
MIHIDPSRGSKSIDPSPTHADAIRAVKSDMTTRFNREATARVEARAKTAALMTRAQAPFLSLIEADPHAKAALNELKKLNLQPQQPRTGRGTGPTRIVLVHFQPPQPQLATPPFDADFHLGPMAVGPLSDSPDAWADKATGKFGFQLWDRGWAAAGLGVLVTTSQDAAVGILPVGYFSYNWHNLNDFPNPSHADGLLGFLTYDLTGSGSVVEDAREFIWNDGTSWLEDHSGCGIKSFGSYTSIVNQTIFLSSGKTYLIWTYCWGTVDPRGESSFDGELVGLQFLEDTSIGAVVGQIARGS